MIVYIIIRAIFGLIPLSGLVWSVYAVIQSCKMYKTTEKNISRLNHLTDMIETQINRFSVSDYLDRIEKAWLEILENQEPIDRTIVLWLGLDGLRLNEDGSSEWISRKKKEPEEDNVFYQPVSSILNSRPTIPIYNMCQSTQATLDQVYSLRMNLDMLKFNLAMQDKMQPIYSALQSRLVQAPAYPSCILTCQTCCGHMKIGK